MFEISFFAAEAAFTAIWLLIRISIWIRQKSIDWKREVVLALMYINLAVIIRFVLFPRDLVNGHIQPLVFDTATAFPLRINPVPMVHLFRLFLTRQQHFLYVLIRFRWSTFLIMTTSGILSGM